MIENTSYIVLSQQMAMRRQMDVIANNMANMNTTAFKAERVLFEEFLMDGGEAGKLSFVRDFGASRNLVEGDFTPTKNPLDLGISGKGYLSVETDQGVRYTRNGALQVDPDGFLVTNFGNKVLDTGGRPLQVDPNDPKLDIAGDGTVSNSQGQVARLALSAFDNEQNLKSVGNGLYKTDDQPTPATEARLHQGMLENSNVEPILEITKMIELSRTYQATQTMITRDDDIRRKGIEKLGRVG